MPDESDDTALPGLPTSVADTEPDFGNLLDSEENQAFKDFEQEFLYGSTESAASEDDAAADDSTQDEVAAQDDESVSDEESTEEPKDEQEEPEEEVEDEATEEEEPEEQTEETAEERLERLERENQELKKRVSGASRKAHPRDRQAQEIAALQQKLQALEAEKVEAQRIATLKPFHPDHPDHGKYEMTKERVGVYKSLRSEYGSSEEDQEKLARAMVRLGLKPDDVQMVEEGEEFERAQAVRFATDPQFRREIIAKDYDALRSEEVQRERQMEEDRKILEDPQFQKLMTEKFPEEFDALWNAGHHLGYISERLNRLQLAEELKEAKASKNRVKASATAKKSLDKKKAAGATEVNQPPASDSEFAVDFVDRVKKEYESTYNKPFIIDRPDCAKFLDEKMKDAKFIHERTER